MRALESSEYSLNVEPKPLASYARPVAPRWSSSTGAAIISRRCRPRGPPPFSRDGALISFQACAPFLPQEANSPTDLEQSSLPLFPTDLLPSILASASPTERGPRVPCELLLENDGVELVSFALPLPPSPVPRDSAPPSAPVPQASVWWGLEREGGYIQLAICHSPAVAGLAAGAVLSPPLLLRLLLRGVEICAPVHNIVVVVPVADAAAVVPVIVPGGYRGTAQAVVVGREHVFLPGAAGCASVVARGYPLEDYSREEDWQLW